MEVRDVSQTLRAGVCLAVFHLFLLASGIAFAMPAAPVPFDQVQPDGTTVTLRLRGDENYHWLEDVEGYSVVKNNGRFEYAVRGSNGHLKSNGLVVGRDNPRAAGLQKHVQPSPAARAEKALKVNGVSVGGEGVAAEGVAPAGNIKNLVVMVRFSNHVGRTLPSVADMNVLFNATSPHPTLAPTGSVRGVYLENSYGQMTLDSDINPGINNWITVSNTEQFYANGDSGDSTLWLALREALNALDAVIDFRDYDADQDGLIDSVAFIHSGYAAEWGGSDAFGTAYQNRIWSHRWAIQPAWNSNDGVSVFDYHISPGVWGTSGSAIGRIGVIAHETGHFFGLPDLYDTDSSAGEGAGSWELMANSWGFDFSQLCPPHFSPWSKIQLGFYSPTLLTTPGQYTINQAETNPQAYRVSSGYPSGEYLLIENRQNAGFDCSIPQGGIAIWHIDDSVGYNSQGYPGQVNWPANGLHYRVALLQADGNYHLEKGTNRGDSGDMHHAAGVNAIAPGPGGHPNTDAYKSGVITQTGHTISSISASGPSMTFCFNGCVSEPPAAPTNLTAAAVSSSQINLAWSDVATTESGYRVERSSNGTSSWTTLATLAVNSTSYSNTGLAASTPYYYRVAAFNAAGDSGFATANTTTQAPPAFVNYFAQAQLTTEGTVSGGFANTTADDGVSQGITEIQTGGSPSKRRSSLTHRWTFNNIVPGTSTTLTANAWQSASTDGDNFQFRWSTDGTTFTNAFLVTSTSSSNQQSAVLPSNLSGTVYIQVIDSNDVQGNSTTDTVNVDYLTIRVDNTPVTPPAAPTGLGTTAIVYNRVDLSWTDNASDETAYQVQRATGGGSYSTIATLAAGATTYSDASVSASTSYNYKVQALKGSTVSADSNVLPVTTPAPPPVAITLSASGYKVKGMQRVDLTWSGATSTNVDIRRNGNVVTTTNNDGVHTDNIGVNGSATYQYTVCHAGTGTCSNTVTVVF